MKRLYLPLLALLATAVIVFAMAFVSRENGKPDKHLEIVMRNIGHQLLLHSGDSSSRVMPVKMVDDNTFRISFETSFGFTPDTLMSLVHQQLANTERKGNYMVGVYDCSKNQTVFAYEMNTASGDLTPCRGRKLKKDCYVVEISFPGTNSFNYAWLLAGLVPLALIVFYMNRRKARPEVAAETVYEDEAEAPAPATGETAPETSTYIPVGALLFSDSEGTLAFNGQNIELSAKEIKAMRLFASNLNQVVGRDLLMKEIWEDEGVVVITRNVDVLISKLRKKLGVDPSLRIVNVHGKGYKLATGSKL
ncbi:MAG: winged helix family transcriptional regulator [Chitinophagaceae bacterium]|nr:MAG: winged helix family transcriptional regulator [Chitinophagaceae bacterium]